MEVKIRHNKVSGLTSKASNKIAITNWLLISFTKVWRQPNCDSSGCSDNAQGTSTAEILIIRKSLQNKKSIRVHRCPTNIIKINAMQH